MLLAAGLILATAAWLEPDPSGYGTHHQLGLAGCPLPMVTGYPCPSCGMTTAFAHAVRGQVLSAFVAQPAGLCLAMGVAVAAIMAGYSLATGQSWRFNEYRLSAYRVAFGVVGVILFGWGFKIVMGWMTGRIPWP